MKPVSSANSNNGLLRNQMRANLRDDLLLLFYMQRSLDLICEPLLVPHPVLCSYSVRAHVGGTGTSQISEHRAHVGRSNVQYNCIIRMLKRCETLSVRKLTWVASVKSKKALRGRFRWMDDENQKMSKIVPSYNW